MKPLYRYSVLAVLCLVSIAVLGSTFSGPVIYSLKSDLFPSVFHENTDALKVESFNSTLDLLPLMQDLVDYSGPIVLNINIRDMDQVRYYLDLLSRSNVRLKNLVINLEMSDSEIEEFSKNKELQQKLLQELIDSTISLDELDSLMIRYRDDQNMLVSIELQREALLKRIHEILNEYKAASEKIQAISENVGLDSTQEKESVKEFETLVSTMDKKAPREEIPVPRIPTLSLLVNPETGKYGDSIGLSGAYRSSTGTNGRYPVTVFIENSAPVSTSTGPDGLYKTDFAINRILPGEHSLHAVSGMTISEYRTLTVIPVDSTTSLDIQPVYNRPEIVCYGFVFAGEVPVRDAPVEIISDYHTVFPRTSDETGSFQAQIVLSPGVHQVQAQFVNASYPLFSSKSPVYLVEAGRDSILGIRLLDHNMSADDLTLAVEPATATYKDVITLSGALSGRDPKEKTLGVFIDGALSHRLATGPDGSYRENYTIETMKAGTHVVFTRYSEPDAGEIYSLPRPVTVTAADSATVLDVEVTDGGTGLVCTGNVTARALAVASAPVELVWDDRNIIRADTDATGSFRQKISLPAGNHSIFARFAPRDLPITPSRSRTYTVTLYPPVDLTVTPRTVQYLDEITFSGALHGKNSSFQDIRLLLDGRTALLAGSDAAGLFSTLFTIENIAAGDHTVQAVTQDFPSEIHHFSVLPDDTGLDLGASLIPGTAQVTCAGTLAAGTRAVRNAPVLIVSDNQTVLETRTDRYGHFEDTVTLPPGTHRLKAVFTGTSLFPLNPSESRAIEIEIPRLIAPGNLTVQVVPGAGIFGEVLDISGTLSAQSVSGEPVRLFIDGKKTADVTTSREGHYSHLYTIDRLPSGSHSAEAVSGNLRSDPAPFQVYPASSATTLSLRQVPGTPRLSCSGSVSSLARPVRLAPVTLVINNGTRIVTSTDEAGNYSETITLPAGTYRMQAFFNSTDIFPLDPSASIPAEIEMVPQLSLAVRPASGIYHDTLVFEGTLVRPGTIEGSDVDIFIDNNYAGTEMTGPAGYYSYPLTLERISAGKHHATTRSGSWSSGTVTFQVLPVLSQTQLAISAVNQSALYECTGRVMAFDIAGVFILKPVTVRDAEAILKSLWKNPHGRADRPVISAMVVITANNRTLVETTTDAGGRFSELVTLPEGQNVVVARFVNDSYPVFSSRSTRAVVDTPSANLTQAGENGPSPVGIPGPLAAVVVLLLFAAGAGYYLKRNSMLFRDKRPLPEDVTGPELPPAGGSSAVPAPPADLPHPGRLPDDPVFAHYLRVLHAEGLSSAARAAYVHFTGTIAQTLHIRNPRALTPREFLQACEEKPFAAPVASFIALYEQIRYGGARSPEKQGEFEESIRITDRSLEGEHHE
jgi:hypothetical protein